MKNKIKYLLIFAIILISTGCSGNYNLIINEDMSIDEELNLTLIDKSELYSKTVKIFEDAKIPKDNYNVSISNGDIEIIYKQNYPSIEEYILNSKAYRQLFTQIEYNNSSKYIDLYLDENIKQQNNYNKLNGTNLTDFDFIQVNITNPFEVNFTNAEIVNDNVYTWTIKKDDISKKFQMQFRPTLNIFPYREILVSLAIILCIAIMTISITKRFKKSKKV